MKHELEGTPDLNSCDPSGVAGYIFFTEMVCTAIFVSVIISVVNHTKSSESLMGALAISVTLYGSIMIAGNSSGGCINPAIGLVQSFLQHSALDNSVGKLLEAGHAPE